MKSYSIGRDLGCDIVMNDHSDMVSRRHAVLTVSSTGKMTITDQSSNGTYVNGIKISPNVPVPVTRKDSVSFAHVATLDWNMIPKSRMWINYLIVALGVAAIAFLLVLLLTRERTPINNPLGTGKQDTENVVDTVKSKPVDKPVDTIKMDTVKPKTDTVKAKTETSKQDPKTDSKSDKKKDNKKQNAVKAKDNKTSKTDTVKNAQLPLGV